MADDRGGAQDSPFSSDIYDRISKFSDAYYNRRVDETGPAFTDRGLQQISDDGDLSSYIERFLEPTSPGNLRRSLLILDPKADKSVGEFDSKVNHTTAEFEEVERKAKARSNLTPDGSRSIKKIITDLPLWWNTEGGGAADEFTNYLMDIDKAIDHQDEIRGALHALSTVHHDTVEAMRNDVLHLFDLAIAKLNYTDAPAGAYKLAKFGLEFASAIAGGKLGIATAVVNYGKQAIDALANPEEMPSGDGLAIRNGLIRGLDRIEDNVKARNNNLGEKLNYLINNLQRKDGVVFSGDVQNVHAADLRPYRPRIAKDGYDGDDFEPNF